MSGYEIAVVIIAAAFAFNLIVTPFRKPKAKQ